MAIFALILWGVTSLSFADQLLEEGDAFHAITEYKRLLYLGDLDPLYGNARIAWAYEQRGRWQEAGVQGKIV